MSRPRAQGLAILQDQVQTGINDNDSLREVYDNGPKYGTGISHHR